MRSRGLGGQPSQDEAHLYASKPSKRKTDEVDAQNLSRLARVDPKLLVSGAHYVLGPFGSDSDLRRHGKKIAARGGKNSKKRAAVAVARKLSVLSCTVCG